MYVLHIEHPITTYETWKAAFDRFAEARAAAGVLDHRIARPADDDHWIVVDLRFAARQQAEDFLDFLRTAVWARPEASPGLAGQPEARILAEDETGSVALPA